MGANGVVPEEPIDQLLVEGGYVIAQERAVPYDEVLGYGAVEPLDERV